MNKLLKALKQQIYDSQKIREEGRDAFKSSGVSYSIHLNPYKDSPARWDAYHWQCGFQEAYLEEKMKAESYKYELPKEPEYNMRNEGESTGIDRYFGRGL